MSERIVKAGAHPDRRRILSLVAEGALTAQEASLLLRGAAEADARPAAPGSGPLAIAVVGMAARLADADGLDAVWAMLRDGRSAICPLPAARRGPAMTGRLPRAGFLPDPEAFDAGFFRISPTEAALMDPQQRLFLEQAYHALEDAGLGGEALSEARCGVYVGAGSGDFSEVLKARGVSGNPLALMGNVPSILAARISYFLNLKGPSLAVDTACSSSLTALGLAVEALRAGTVDVALAGGVCVISTPEFMASMAAGGMLSPTDACHTFDRAADGFVCGEGAVALVLKTLDRALADGDRIHGVVRALGSNQDGRTNGITAPSGTAQQALEEDVYRRCDIDPRGIGYVESHGTGTPLGDPIEVDALTGAFRRFTADRGFCRIGSIKTNIGHTLTAAGLAGVVKVLLMMRHRTIVPSLNFSAPNPRIDLAASPFRVATALEPWEAEPGRPRRAAVSSFGFSGTNVHLVLEEAPEPPARPACAAPQPVLLSARTPAALAALAGRLRDRLGDEGEVEPRDVALTLGVGRGALACRAGFDAATPAELLAGLAAVANGLPTAPGGPVVRAFVADGQLPGRAAFDPAARRLSLPGYPFERRVPGAAVFEAAAPAATVVVDETVLRAHGAAFGRAEDWGRTALAAEMAGLGLFATGRAAFTRAWARRRFGVVDGRARLFDALLGILARSGHLVLEGDLVRPGPAPAADDPRAARQRLAAELPAAVPFLDLLAATLGGLVPVLTGRRSAMEVLFPGGKADLVEAVYRGNPLAEELNRRLAARIGGLAAAHRCDAPLRVLEVGGGTGGATRAALSALSAWGGPAAYCFTDVARAFVDAAPRGLAPGAGAVAFEARLFDIEAPPPPEVAALGPFDVVIASNVLHATRRVATTLQRLHGVMAPGGALVLNEVVSVQDFATLTFGLTDGWWAFEDAEDRLADAPVLSVDGWRTALAGAGFPGLAVDAISGPDGRPVQAVLSATRDGRPALLGPSQDRGAPPQGNGNRAVPAATNTDLEGYLAGVVATVLTMPASEVDRRGRFMDLGLDSILGVALVERLNADLGVDLRPTVVFDHPTVADLARHLGALGAHRAATAAAAPAPADPVAGDQRIAVIGVSARFADAGDLGAFRAMLREGRSGIIEVPASRWRPAVDAEGAPDPYERWGGFLVDAEGFDPLVFRISGREAELTDPQHRVFLMEAWRALEDAGYGEAALDGLRCGVFVGAHGGDYTHRMTQAGVEPEAFAFMGNAAAILAARIAYMLNLKGPALAVDTACSSSLVAVHMACRSILDGDCDMALAGGVFVTTTKGFNVAAGKAGMLSPHGRCAAFDADADGFVPGEGGGVVLLKPLGRAIADGDNIQAVILGSGVNQDGKTNGITAPSPESQAALHRAVYRRFGIDPCGIGYVEAHGTGTPLGDPIEVEGLARAWADWGCAPGSAAIGSVKTNVGHAAHAAGIGGFVKAVLAVRDGEIHPSLHFRRENPRLGLAGTPFRVPTALEPWHPAGDAPRRAAVSSFGFSGTNCHVVLEQPPQRTVPPDGGGPFLVLLSAKTASALAARRAELAAHLERTRPRLADVARTLAVGRTHFERRWAMVAADLDDLIAGLKQPAVTSSSDAALQTEAGRYRSGEAIALDAIAPEARRIGLPTYPFELNPYWITIDAAAPAAAPAETLTVLAPRWLPLDPAPAAPAAGTLLLVGACGGLADAWAAAGGGGTATLPADADPAAVERAAAGADAIVLAGGLRPEDPSVDGGLGAALLAAVRAALRTPGRRPPILLLHHGAPFDAALASFGRSVAFLGIGPHVRSLTVPAMPDPATLVRELLAGGPRAVRQAGGRREGRRLEPVSPVAAPAAADTAPVALVTGGGGVLAQLLAVRLAARPGAAVALLGRGAASEAVTGTLRAIEAAGGRAEYRRCDVADRDGLAAAVRAVEERFGPVGQVYHLAGVPSPGVVSDKSWDDMRAVLRPKVDGLLALDDVLGDRRLSRFVVFSSLAAELGDFGQCDYGLANAYAGRFAEWREAARAAGRRHGRTLAIGWPLWAEGRAVMSASGSRLFTEATGLRAIGTDAAFRVLDAALAGSEPDVVVVPGDAAAARALVEEQPSAPTVPAPSAPMANPAPAAGREPGVIADRLVAMVAAQMRLPAERLARDANLADFGFDSIALKEFAAAISGGFGVTLSPAVFFAHGSIDALAAHLQELGAGSPPPPPAAGPVAAPLPATTPRTAEPAVDGGSDRAVAIIGMAGRFPGSPDPEAFWRHLEAGDDMIGPMPEERRDWGLDAGSGVGGYLDGVDRFDHAFFGLPPRDALLMDPQHRLAVEAAWNAVENAGIRMSALAGRRVAVMFASQVNEYARLVPFEEPARAQLALGNIAAMVANRISFLFDLRGPSEAVDTACSGSLVAVHRAVQALRAGEAELAIAGGVSLMLGPDSEETTRRLGVASPDGRCFVFDARANGYVKGEGVGAVVLKPLAAARRDGDPVLAVIRGSAVGHGGHAQTITAPSLTAQAEVIARAVRDAGIEPASIGYVEAHGTGTELGDPVEIEGLKQAFRDLGRTAADGACPVGSVKSNIGHLEPAAGIAGLVKVVLALRNRTLPASLHLRTLNPLIELSDGLLRIADRAAAWPANRAGTPRRAGLSSFGFGGANAHLVVEEAPGTSAASAMLRPVLLVLSAADADRLAARCEALALFLAETPVPATVLAATLMLGREDLVERMALRLSPGEDPAARLGHAVAVLRGTATDPAVVTGRAGAGGLPPGVETDGLLRELAAEGALARIARLWVAGTAVDWRGLGLAEGPRAAMPGYPFAGPRLWFKGRPVGAGERPAHSAPAPALATEPFRPSPVPESPEADPQPAHRVPSFAQGASNVADRIARLVADALYVEAEAIERTAGLADLGLDSILAVELVQAIKAEFGTALQAARLYDYPTVEALAAFVAGGAAVPVAVPAEAPPPARPASVPLRVAGGDGVLTEIRRIVADALYIDPEHLDETAGFGDLGLDSILAVEVVQAINARFGVALQAARLYDHPTVADLARHVAAMAAGGAPADAAIRAPTAIPGPAAGSAAVLALLCQRIAAALGRDAADIDPSAPLTAFAIDPETAGRLVAELAAATGVRPSFEQIARFPNLAALAAFMAGQGAAAVPADPPPPVASPAIVLQPAAAPVDGAVAAVVGIVAEVLAVEPAAIDPDTALGDLGVDLVQAGEIAFRLNRQFGGALKARGLLQLGSAAAIAAGLAPAPPDGPSDPTGGRPIPARPAATGPQPAVRSPAPATPDAARAVAIVGIAARYPGAPDKAAFWRLLDEGRSAVGPVPAERWSVDENLAGLDDPRQRAAVRWGGFVDGVDRFDPLFFGLSPKEAEVMDPQQRIFLEEAWHALEDAGLTREALKGAACGVFVGGGQGDYVHLLPRDGSGLSGQMLLGNTTSILAARIAYFLDLKGPSLAIDTACSSGLVATHYAVRSLLEGECEIALAGGIGLMLTPQMHLMTAASGMLAVDGRCKTFDDGADGFVPGEGLGIVVLKRLERAVADGDRIYATILGSGVNQDGRTASITAPSAASQARLEIDTHRRAGIDVGRVGYVEAHGTGTRLGDPIEVSALAEAFAAAGPAAPGTVAIGSVKTNIGHTLASAGSAGLIKTALARYHGSIPASLNFERANTEIDFAATPFRVATARAEWPADRPLALVSSFGFSGTNAHLVLGPAPVRTPVAPASGVLAFPLSAPSAPALRRLAAALADGLADAPDLAAVAHTLARRRSRFRARAVAAAADRAGLVAALRAIAAPEAALDRPVGAVLPEALAADAATFLSGGRPDWAGLPAAAVADLPGYPFDRRRFWVDMPAAAPRPAAPDTIALPAAHPLLAGHVVGGRALLPGTASLAIAQARLGGWVAVSGLAWERPVEAGPDGLRLRVEHAADGGMRIADGAVRAVVAAAGPPGGRLEPAPAGTAVEAAAIYRFLGETGIAYGPEFRRIAAAAVEASAVWLSFTPAAAFEDAGPEGDGPVDTGLAGLLDAALHGLAGFAVAGGDGAALLMPARLEHAVIGPDTRRATRARLTRRPGSPAGSVVADVVLADAADRIVGLLSGLHAMGPASRPAGGAHTFLLAPSWAPAAAGERPAGGVAVLVDAGDPAAGAWARELVREATAAGRDAVVRVLDGGPVALPGDAGTIVFVAFGPGTAPSGPATLRDAEAAGVHRLLALSRQLVAAGRGCRLRVVTRGVHPVDPAEPTDPSHAALPGFTGTLAREHPALEPVLVDLPMAESPAEARRHRALLLAEPGGTDVAYRAGRRFVRRLTELDLADATGSAPLAAGDVVLILGGAGGIGRAVSLDLARRHGARIAWIGRRPEDDAIRDGIRTVEAAGGAVRYVRADATVPAELARAVQSVEKLWGRIDVVIHATIVLADSRIETMSPEILDAALSAKSRTAVALASALRHRRPKLLAVFSSSNALTCNPGQANYAAGCSFIDAWARAWGRAAGVPVLVVDWGFWGETGIVASEAYRARAVAAGVDPMTTAEGLLVLHRLLAHGVGHAAVMRFDASGRAQVESEVERVIAPPAAGPGGGPGGGPGVGFAESAAALATPPAVDEPALRAAVADVAAIEEHGRRRLQRVMARLGVLRPGDASVVELVERAAIAPGQRRLFEALLAMLARAGTLILRDGRVIVADEAPEAPLDRPAVGRLTAHLRLLDAALDGLEDVLLGRRRATDVLFPGGSTALVEAVYRDNPSSDPYNAAMAGAVAAVAAAGDGTLKVLEVGAGTGGATVAVLAALRAAGRPFEYVFTDLSPMFLDAARARFAEVPGTAFRILDIDADPAGQGFAAGGHDLVIASNVLHATPDLARSVDNAKALLRPGGVLLLNEMTAASDLATLTFGLTDGWWGFRDPEARLPHGPLLDPEGWGGLLRRAGFPDVAYGGLGPDSGQSIVVARSDGWMPRRRGGRVAVARPAPAAAGQAPAGAAGAVDRGAVVDWLRVLFAEILKLDPEEIAPEESYDSYGVDSLIAMDIRARLETRIGAFPAPLVFEGVSLNGLADVLLREKPVELAAALGGSATAPGPVAVEPLPARPAPEPRRDTAEPVAIIGLAGRYPGGDDADALWDTLAAGRPMARPVPPERWGETGIPGADVAALLDGVDRFDPLFFQIAPAEAAAMDPQERLFLETAWSAIEDAGTTPGRLGGADRRVGVYVGAMRADYQRIGTLDRAAGGSGLAGTAFWSIANRLSFLLNFRGPSLAIDTACSASLTAVHMAVEALRSGRIEAAVAGGVHLLLHPQNQEGMARMGLLSARGVARPFAADADGFVEGEGVGAVVLKRLSDAERDGDRVRAVIRGSAVGAGGRTAGYMMPNPAAAAALLHAALHDAGVRPAEVGHVESHASGSPIADPVEAAALARVYGDAGGSRSLGTVKGVVGHLSAASGIAQLTKVVLQLERRSILPSPPPPVLHPDVRLPAGMAMPAEAAAWTGAAGRLVATVTASGAGGADAVLVLSDAPAAVRPETAAAPAGGVFPLSARNPERLAVLAGRLADRLEQEALPLPAVAWTLQAGREAMAARLAAVADDRETLVRALRSAAAGEDDRHLHLGKVNGHAPEAPGPAADAASLARHWVRGAAVEWPALWGAAPPRPVSLPGYPFERRRCWIEGPAARHATASARPVSLPATRRALAVHRPADVDAVALEPMPLPPPGENEVVVAVEAFSLNFGDLLALRGSYPNQPAFPFVPGMEVVGRIAAVGPGVSNSGGGGRRIGERVAALTAGRGGHADHVTVPAALTFRVPEGVDPAVAAAFPIGYLTARHALDRAGLAPGETVLVTSAAGGVGPILVQLAVAAGARVLATVGSAAKVPAVAAFGAEGCCYASDDVAAWVRNRAPAGVDVVLNMLGGDALQQGLGLLAPGGRYVEIALAGLMAGGRVDLSRLLDNQSLITVNLGRILASPQQTRAVLADAEAALAAGSVRPLVDSVYRFDDVRRAYERMAGRGAVGRIVVAVDPGIPAREPAVPQTDAPPVPPPVPPPAPRALAACAPAAADCLAPAIAAVVAGVLGLDSHELPPDQAFDALGLTSVSGLEIARRLESVAGRPVPVTLLWQHRTVVELAAALGGEPAAAQDVSNAPRSPLVEIRRGGETAPLFLVHGAPGEVSWAVDLAGRLGVGIPVHAFEAPGLHGDRPVPDRVEAFAGLYARLLEEAHPAGDYWIGGYSGGGAIAFETARLLAARGRPATGLVLLDANAPGTESLRGMDQAFGDGFIHRLAANWLGERWGGGTVRLPAAELAAVDAGARTGLVVDHLFRTASPPMPRAEAHAMIDGMDAVAGAIGRALSAYRPAPIDPPLPTLLVRCSRGMAPAGNPLDLPAFLTEGDYRAGWADLVGGAIDTVDIDCDHFSLVLEPHVNRLATAIRDRLNAAGRTDARRARVAAVVLDKVRRGLADVPEVAVTPDRSMTELGATSLDRVEIALAAMEELGLDIPPRDLTGLANIDGLIDTLHRHMLACSDGRGPAE